MVEAQERTPHTLAIEPYSHRYLVGIEKTSGQNGYYISKGYCKRKNLLRGSTHIIKIKGSDLDKFYKLEYSYYSYVGREFDYATFSEVTPVEKLMTVYE